MNHNKNTNNRKFINTCIGLFVFIAIFLGCGNGADNGSDIEANGMKYTFDIVSFDSTEYASEKDVERAVQSHVEQENIEYSGSYNGCFGEGYEYSSLDRDLKFIVRSDLEGISTNPLTAGADKKQQVVYVYYPVAVSMYYDDEIANALEQSSLDYEDSDDEFNYNVGGYFAHKLYIRYKGFAELDYIATILAEIDDIYKQETNYNSQAFMTEYPVRKIMIEYIGSGYENEDKGYIVSGLYLDGTWDKESLYEMITKNHADCIANGKIVDDTTPGDLKTASHKDSLFNIYLDGVNITDKAYDERYKDYSRTRTHARMEDVIYTSIYYEPLDTYLILFDVGTTSQPDLHISTTKYYIDEIIGASSISLGANHSQVTWEFMGDDWSIDSEEGEYGSTQLFNTKFIKNGIEQTIPIVYPWDGYRMEPNYFGIPVENFAEIFDLSYEIDESADDGTIFFMHN